MKLFLETEQQQSKDSCELEGRVEVERIHDDEDKEAKEEVKEKEEEDIFAMSESWFLESPRETNIGSRNQGVKEIRG